MRASTFIRCLGLVLALACHAALAAGPVAIVELDGHEVAADRVLVRWKDHVTPPASLAAALAKRAPATRGAALRALAGSTVTARTYAKLPGVALLRISRPLARGGGDAAAAAATLKRHIETLRASGLFDYVEPDHRVHVSLQPTDSAYTDGTLWGLRNTGRDGGVAGVDIDAPAAWNVTTGASTAVVAVIDTGVRYTHRELSANMWRNPGEIAGNGRDDDHNGYVDDVYGINAITGSGNPLDDHGHGTHVSGTIGAAANGGGPHVGVAWNVRIMALKFLDAQGSGYDSDAIECIDYAIAKGARVLSNSWGGDGFSAATRDAIARARDAGALFVAAAGNDGRDTDAEPTYPAGYALANVLSVGAIDRSGARAWFTNYGATSVDLAAPGVDIYSTLANSDTAHGSMSGTSMATPHVSGVAALLLARYPGIGLGELRQRLLAGATPLASFAGASVTGGLLNADRALRASADGALEVRGEIPDQPLRPGASVTVLATVTDLMPVAGASVTAGFDNEAPVSLRDDGVAPDMRADDGVHAGTLTVPGGTAQVTLQVAASAPGKLAASAQVVYPVASPPGNDDFDARTVLAGGSTRATGTTRYAGVQQDEPRHPASAGGHSAWWSWTASVDGPVTIDTYGSDFDTTLAVYTGNNLGDLALVDANDDSASLQSAVTFEARAGVSYALQVDGFLDSQGAVVLNFPPAGSADGAPQIVTEPVDQVVVPGGVLALAVGAEGGDLGYQWFKDDAPLAGENAASLRREHVTAAEAGAYHAEVSNAGGVVASRHARVRVGAPVANDDFAAATVLEGDGRVQGTNVAAGGEAGEPDHAGASQPLASTWYRWTAPADGRLVLSTAGSNFDTTLALYRGDTLASLILVAANDDANGTVQSALAAPVTAGTTYAIAVDGFDIAEGQLQLERHFEPTVASAPNDDFDAATLFTGTRVRGDNRGASGEAGEPNHAGRSAPPASVWWRWVAPRDGRVMFDTAGSDFDTTLAVYTGSRVDRLTLLDADDDARGAASRVAFTAVAGRSYYLAVDGYQDARGTIVLSLRRPPERPDVFARRGVVVGRNRFLPENQVLTASLRRGETRVVTLFVQNAGTVPHQYRLALSGNLAARGVRTTLLAPQGNLTRAARNGLVTPRLQPGQFLAYALRVEAGRGALPPGFLYRATLRVSDVAAPAAEDRLRIELVAP